MEQQNYRFKVDNEENNMRLDMFLSRHLDFASRREIQEAIKSGKVRVEFNKTTKKIKPSYQVCEGDIISINLTQKTIQNAIIAEDIPLQIEYQDEDILIINKPIGITVHPGAGTKSGTIANAVKFLLKENISSLGGEERPGIVHRLDKDTSGLLIIAKNNMVHYRLSRMFERKLIKKQYIALTSGIFEFDEDRIDAPIERDPIYREKFKVGYGPNAREAQTDYKIIKRFPEKNKTLVFFMPLTGRTHQIRVHSKYIGHPIVGDRKYNPTKDRNFPRLCLHALRLEFKHPITGKLIQIESELPEFTSPPLF